MPARAIILVVVLTLLALLLAEKDVVEANVCMREADRLFAHAL